MLRIVKVTNKQTEMFRHLKVILVALLVLTITESVKARKISGGRHSYPKSTGLSGSSGHNYPVSGGLSGNNRGYPSSGGNHGYPPSGGLSGSGTSTGGNHGYPSSGNSHGYPASGGLSGSGNHGYPTNKGPTTVHHTTTNIHHHYNYNPPQRISYTPVHGGPPMSYPVYRGQPPTYVYQYKNSDSKYGTLLAGLALLNLGTLAGGLYANTHRHTSYKPSPGEICKFGIRKDNGDYQETKIDCQLITSFIFEEEAKAASGTTNSTVTTTTVTNVTVVNTTNTAAESLSPLANGGEPLYPVLTMFPNGTMANNTAMNATAANSTASAPNNSSTGSSVVTSSVTSVTTTNTTVTNALDVKGKPIDVTPGMKCYVIRTSPTSNMRRSVPCGLLQSYADQSIKKNSAATSIPSITILFAAISAIALY